VTHPVHRQAILNAVSKTGGRLYPVNERDLCLAQEQAARRGLYLEYSAAVALAALPHLTEETTFLVPITGTGLKDF
jgi:threonine synthase